MLQAKIQAIYYPHDWMPANGGLREQYEATQRMIPGGIHRVDIHDLEAVGCAAPKPV